MSFSKNQLRAAVASASMLVSACAHNVAPISSAVPPVHNNDAGNTGIGSGVASQGDFSAGRANAARQSPMVQKGGVDTPAKSFLDASGIPNRQEQKMCPMPQGGTGFNVAGVVPNAAGVGASVSAKLCPMPK